MTTKKSYSAFYPIATADGAKGSAAFAVGDTMIHAYLSPEAVSLIANDIGIITSYATAITEFIFELADGTNISSNFSLATATGGNPYGLTVNYTDQTIAVTAGFSDALSIVSVTIEATGSGAYAGIVITRTFVLVKNTVNENYNAYLSPTASVLVPTDDTDTILDWSPAVFEFIVQLKDGTDISNQFTLTTPLAGNPDGLTGTIDNASNPRKVTITGGLTAAEDPGTIVIRGTGTGSYTGVVIQLIATINMDYSGVALSYVLEANDNNGLIPDAVPSITNVLVVNNTKTGNVEYKGSWTFPYNSSAGHKNNIDGFVTTTYKADTNATYTIKKPFETGGENQQWHSYYMPMGSATYTKQFPAFSDPTKWYTIGVIPIRKVHTSVDPAGIIFGPVTQYGPFQPSSTQIINDAVVLGSTVQQPASTVAVATTNFNADNDGNGLVPDAVTGVAATYTIDNTHPTSRLQIGWTFTPNATPSHKNSIDGYKVGMYPHTSSSWTYNSSYDASMTWQYIDANQKFAFFAGEKSDRFYHFVIFAYRQVRTDINTTGRVYSAVSASTYVQPNANLALGGTLVSNISTATSRANTAITSGNLINTNAVITDSVLLGAINSVYGGSTGTDLDLTTASTWYNMFTVSLGSVLASSSLVMEFSGTLVMFTSGGGTITVDMQFVEASSLLTASELLTTQFTIAAGGTIYLPFTATWVWTGVSANSYTIYPRARRSGGATGPSVYFSTRSIVAKVIKR